MLSTRGRRPASVVVEPVARALLRAGLTPNMVTVIGTVVTSAIAVLLIPGGHLFTAAVASGLFAAFDLVDGTMARLRGGGTKFGATLDATCDRVTDGVLFASVIWWLIFVDDAYPALVVAAFVVLIASQVTSYVKARGEASGFTILGGLVERPERLIIALVGLGLEGLGVSFAIETAIWVLAFGSVYTVIQRLYTASRNPEALAHIAPPPGTRDSDPQGVGSR